MKINLFIKSRFKSYSVIIQDKGVNKSNLKPYVANRNNILIISDSGIPKKYINDLKKTIRLCGVSARVLTISNGEQSKSFKNYQYILEHLAEKNFARDDLIIALGGGVVGDISGFVASTYLRGIDFIQIPTTLLAQVDSSVGGKTAINSKNGKNLFGAFYNPSLVIIDPSHLNSLAEREYKAGLAEVIKYGLIDNRKLFNYLKKNYESILDKDTKALSFIISESIKSKTKIVQKDEREKGLRAILNFGHTFGHALEAKYKYKKYLHGEAVAIGMRCASKISLELKLITTKEFEAVLELFDKLKIKSNLPNLKLNDLMPYLKRDKKILKGKIRFILLDGISKAKIEDKVSWKVLRNIFN